MASTHRPVATVAALAALLLAALALSPAPAAALDPARPLRSLVRDLFRDRDGLPENAVRALLHASSGLLWIATDEGLARYDGATFTPVGRREDPGLPSELITALAETRDGVLWVGTSDGGLVRRGATRFEPVPIHGAPQGLRVNALLAGREGGLWVGSGSGVYHLQGDQVRAFTMASGLPDDRVTALAEDERGVLWVGTRRGLARIEAGQVRAGPSELRGDFISALCADPAGGLWIGTGERGVARLDGAGLRLVGAAQGLPASTIMALTVDRDGALWIALQTAGVARLRDGKVEHLGAKEGLASDWVATVLEDREGSIWLGTQDGGLVRLRVADFRTIGAAEGLSHDAVEAVMQAANGDLWLATDGGVDLLKGGVLPATRIAAGTTMALRQDRSGDVWIGTVGMGLWRWRQGVLTRLGQDLPPNAWVRAIQEDREGTLWVGTSSGLYRLRGERLLPVEDGLPTQRPGVAALAVSAKGELFAALEGAGVYRRGGGRWKREDAGPPDAWMVGDFLADEDGTIWMASEGGGLWRRRGGSYAHVTTAQGFHADACWAILDDGQGNLWMSSNRGIFRVARADLEAVLDGKAPTLRPRAWTMDDGLRGQEAAGASQPGGWRTRDGRLWFALLSGAASVDPARLRPPPAMPEVALRAVEVRGLPQRHDAPLTLPPEAGRLELEFAARVLLGQKSAWFRYRLAGFEEAWSEPQRGHAAQYTNLPPGDFRFEVQTRLGDGAWGPVASLEIVQQPPAWRTPAALAGAAGGALALALGLFLLGLRLGRRGPPAAG